MSQAQSPHSASTPDLSNQPIDRLTQAVERLYSRSSIWIAFRNGVFAGLGATLGVAILFYFIVWILSLFDFIPGISQVTDILRSSTGKDR